MGEGASHANTKPLPAKEGAICHGIEIAPQALISTQKTLKQYGFSAKLFLGEAAWDQLTDTRFSLIYSLETLHYLGEKEIIIDGLLYRLISYPGKKDLPEGWYCLPLEDEESEN